MTPEQNKDFILNNPDKFIISSERGDFFNLEKDYEDSDYVIWKSNVKDYEEVKEKVIQAIIKDKSKWKLITNKEVLYYMVEAILLEKEDWEIVYENLPNGIRSPIKYSHRPTGEEVNSKYPHNTFNFQQMYVLNGELGWRESMWKDYDKWECYKENGEWVRRQKSNPTNTTSQPEPLSLKSQIPSPEQTNQDKKSTREIKQNLKKAQIGTKKEREQALKNLEKQETEKGYNENKTEIEKLKIKRATENPKKYSEEVQQRMVEKLAEGKVEEEELNEENQQALQKIKKGEITDPKQLIATETKIKENIYQKEAEKKITDLTIRANEILKSNLDSSKSQIETLKKELLAFINSRNIYYTNNKETAEKLLTQLENYSTVNNNQINSSPKPLNFPWKAVIPFLLVGLLTILVIMTKKRITKTGLPKKVK